MEETKANDFIDDNNNSTINSNEEEKEEEKVEEFVETKENKSQTITRPSTSSPPMRESTIAGGGGEEGGDNVATDQLSDQNIVTDSPIVLNDKTAFVMENEDVYWECPPVESSIAFQSHLAIWSRYDGNNMFIPLENHNERFSFLNNSKIVNGILHVRPQISTRIKSEYYSCQLQPLYYYATSSSNNNEIHFYKIHYISPIIVHCEQLMANDNNLLQVITGNRITVTWSLEVNKVRHQVIFQHTNGLKVIGSRSLTITMIGNSTSLGTFLCISREEEVAVLTVKHEAASCREHVYGCCHDDMTIADNLEGGRSCESLSLIVECNRTPFGCCRNKFDIAKGPLYMGCPDRDVPPQHCAHLTVNQTVVNLLSEANHNNFTGKKFGEKIRYRFDVALGRCSPIVVESQYNGELMFVNEEECQRTCIDPRTENRCHLPLSMDHNCSPLKNAPVWSYDSQDMECKQVLCIRNGNAFKTHQECTRACKPDLASLDRCIQPPEVTGLRCKTPVYRMYYDLSEGQCKWFKFSGCSDNQNRFLNLNECDNLCKKQAEKLLKSSTSICSRDVDAGRCYAFTETRWYFDDSDSLCKEFQYSMCGGNFNNFLSRAACQAFCGAREPLYNDLCLTPSSYGNCYGNISRWFYDSSSESCRLFIYSGCGGNVNNYANQMECQRHCSLPSTTRPSTTTTRPRDESENVSVGPSLPGETINYGQNNIERPGGTKIIEINPCREKPEWGDCKSLNEESPFVVVKYYYDMDANHCRAYNYSGCGGSANNFDTKHDCDLACTARYRPPETRPRCYPDMSPLACITEDLDDGETSILQLFYFDMYRRVCIPFNVSWDSECNSHFFRSEEECLIKCRHELTIEFQVQSRCFGQSQNPHYQQCSAALTTTRWKFYPILNVCVSFKTCLANNYEGNSFDTIGTCRLMCMTNTMREVCRMPKEEGPCTSHLQRFYFNSRREKCELFYYSGCLGNSNRFLRQSECQSACIDEEARGGVSTESVTLLETVTTPFNTRLNLVVEQEQYGPMDNDFCLEAPPLGRCAHRGMNRCLLRYHYNAYSARCEPFYTPGHELQLNTFDRIENCQRICENRIRRSDRMACHEPQAKRCSGSKIYKWFYDGPLGECKRFEACSEKDDPLVNQFATSSICRHICKPMNPLWIDVQDICMMRHMVGFCYTKTQRWYFDPLKRHCVTFDACKGEGNNFDSELQCNSTCIPNSIRDVCKMPSDPGACVNFHMYWTYDWHLGKCRQFFYGGCFGNRNRFRTLTECNNMCHVNNVCRLPLEDGRDYCQPANKNSYLLRYYYDLNTRRCLAFYYAGCQGNANQFLTLEQCEDVCVIKRDSNQNKLSTEIIEVSRCMRKKQPILHCPQPISMVRFRYESDSLTCQPFEAAICLGESEPEDSNSFPTLSNCESECKQTTITLPPKRHPRCDMSREKEIELDCSSQYVERFYFESETQTCEFFWYETCDTTNSSSIDDLNSNRFTNQNDCIKTCIH